jgi:hypothetical protein
VGEGTHHGLLEKSPLYKALMPLYEEDDSLS